jgi:hypothetical protein
MKLAVLLALAATIALTGCSPKEPEVVRRIPADKQEEAAKLVAQLVQSLQFKHSHPEIIADAAMKQALAIYGEPVTPPSASPSPRP